MSIENIEKLYYFAGIIVIIPTVVSLVFNIIMNCISYKHSRIREAINMTNYYKDNILIKQYAIRDVFKYSGMTNLLKDIKVSDKSVFNRREIEKSGINEGAVRINFKSEEFINSIVIVNSFYNLKLPEGNSIATNDNNNQNNKTDKNKMNKELISKDFMENIVYDTLNNLEYFSMHFKNKVANEKIAYHSLHQTFVPLVETLYYQISNNNNFKNKYFTNIIWLYKKWKAKENKVDKKIDKMDKE